jgi:hypothetical protein
MVFVHSYVKLPMGSTKNNENTENNENNLQWIVINGLIETLMTIFITLPIIIIILILILVKNYPLNQNLKILGAHSLWMNQPNGEVKQHNGCMLQPLPERHPSKLMIIHIHQIPTVDGCEILHHQPDG